MNIPALLLGIVIVGIAFYLITSPLLRPVEEDPEPGMHLDEQDAKERERESVFTTLGEIEFDYQMKKLSDHDYQSLQNIYRHRAVSIIKEEDAGMAGEPALAKGTVLGKDLVLNNDPVLSGIEKEIEAEVEAELRRLRQQKNHR